MHLHGFSARELDDIAAVVRRLQLDTAQRLGCSVDDALRAGAVIDNAFSAKALKRRSELNHGKWVSDRAACCFGRAGVDGVASARVLVARADGQKAVQDAHEGAGLVRVPVPAGAAGQADLGIPRPVRNGACHGVQPQSRWYVLVRL
jgi:hypothetical protein